MDAGLACRAEHGRSCYQSAEHGLNLPHFARATAFPAEAPMNALLIYPHFPVTFWSFKCAWCFPGKRAARPPLGLMTVAALLPDDWETSLVDTNVA
jgi:hypothetical protein